jgi:peptidyl-dipeptidase A
MEIEARAFVERLSERIHPVLSAYMLAQWNLATTGAPEHQATLQQMGADYTRLFTDDPAEWAQIGRLYADRAVIDDATLRRSVERLYNMFAYEQVAPDQIERQAALEAELNDLYTSFRGTIDGQPVSQNQIKTTLRESRDQEERRAAWEASKQVGVAARDRLLELVELRNRSARALGFRDHYAKAMALQEIDEGELFAVLDDLEARSREPFRAIKERLDAALAENCGVAVGHLRPWHYEDPFFQEPPQAGTFSLDPLFADQDILALATRTFDGLGFEVRDILARSDLFERANKDQHAFCTHIDRLGDDVRILCNIRPDADWMTTTLHELGHAIYDKYLGGDLPFLLRESAHTNTTEAIAMLMGRLATDADWLSQVRGIAGGTALDVAGAARERSRGGQIVFLRWALVMVYFERALYADPRRPDLDTHWWDLVERFQLVRRPDGRAAPDWAAKLHLALTPVYYHNYVLGELTASQLAKTIRARTGGGKMVDNPAVGTWLQDELFDLGARFPWNATVERVTGERLSACHFVEEFVGD